MNTLIDLFNEILDKARDKLDIIIRRIIEENKQRVNKGEN